jgi:hypothetical protein
MPSRLDSFVCCTWSEHQDGPVQCLYLGSALGEWAAISRWLEQRGQDQTWPAWMQLMSWMLHMLRLVGLDINHIQLRFWVSQSWCSSNDKTFGPSDALGMGPWDRDEIFSGLDMMMILQSEWEPGGELPWLTPYPTIQFVFAAGQYVTEAAHFTHHGKLIYHPRHLADWQMLSASTFATYVARPHRP